MTRRALPLLVTALLLPRLAGAQGWQLRLDARAQSASYRGWQADSIPVGDTVSGGSGLPETPDGYIVSCTGLPTCDYWRPGQARHGLPAVLTADAAAWGLGVAGLSLRLRARAGADLAEGNPWYGPDRSVEMVEGYADLDRARYRVRLGRQVVDGRLGYWGIDGGRAWLRAADGAFEASGYAGWGLARASNLTVTSDALNPLGDFQTGVRQGAFGATAAYRTGRASIAAQYHREVSGADYGVTVERGSIAGEYVATRRVALTGGAVYDIASGLWGNWDLGASADFGRIGVSGRVRQYRPLFDLWTIWQAFSPVPYHAVDGTVTLRALPTLSLRATGESYRFAETETSTPLVDIETTGWRTAFGATWSATPQLMVDGELRREFGVGAYANSLQGTVTWMPTPAWLLRANGGHLERPLEYRIDVSTLDWFGVGADWTVDQRLTFGLAVDRWDETRDRPDASTFGWDQTRVAARLTWLLASNADQMRLPPGRPRGTR
jgi:hypothetical protein